MSRTAIATLVFENEQHRETWLEEHGVIPKKHGEYTGVAERVDYEHRREQPVLVFTIDAPQKPARARSLGSCDVTPEARPAPPPSPSTPRDGPLPFAGRFHGKLLSALTAEDSHALRRACASILARGPDAETSLWLARVEEWAKFRGVAL